LATELHSQRLPFDQTPQQRFFSRQVPAKPAGALTADPGLPLSAHPPRVHDSVVRGNPLAAWRPRPWISPPWNGSGTGEYGRRPGGARAKRARSIDGFGTAPYPAAGSGDPFPLSLRSRGTKLCGGEIKRDFSPVERQWNGGVRPKAGRGRERSEPGQPPCLPSGLAAAPPRP